MVLSVRRLQIPRLTACLIEAGRQHQIKAAGGRRPAGSAGAGAEPRLALGRPSSHRPPTRLGDALESKYTTLKILTDKKVRIKKVFSDSHNFSSSYETIKEGKEYKIEVKPKILAEGGKAGIRAVCVIDDTIEKTYLIHVRVK